MVRLVGMSSGSSNIPPGTSSFTYDNSGRMKTYSAFSQTVNWRADGKIDNSTVYLGGTTQYLYDAMGNRAASIFTNGGVTTTSMYINTADGKPLALYQQQGSSALTLMERYLYGSERLAVISGLNNPGAVTTTYTQSPGTPTYTPTFFGYSSIGLTNKVSPYCYCTMYSNTYLGNGWIPWGTGYIMGSWTSTPVVNAVTTSTWGFNKRSYELHDHLGNVRVVIGDTRSGNNAVIKSYYNYYAFGAMINGQTSDGPGYRYGFNGQERDDNLQYGVPNGMGVDYGFKFREYNATFGRFFSIDPLSSKYPYWSPYLFAGNNPIRFLDEEGKSIIDVHNKLVNVRNQIRVITQEGITKNYKNALQIIVKAFDLTKLDHYNKTEYNIRRGWAQYLETESPSDNGLKTIYMGAQNVEAAGYDDVDAANFVLQIAHEYIHIWQVNTLGMIGDRYANEREFLANSFTVFPNSSFVRSMLPEWHAEFAEVSDRQKWICSKEVLQRYQYLLPELKEKYRAEYEENKAVFEKLDRIYCIDVPATPPSATQSSETSKVNTTTANMEGCK